MSRRRRASSRRTESAPVIQPSPATWQDLLGKHFGRLRPLGYAGEKTRYGQKLVACHCDCGLFAHVMAANLRSGSTTSCGCAQSEKTAQRNRARSTHGHASGGKVTAEYRAWCSMLSRCTNKNDPRYIWYGARGIGVCVAWRDNFAAFLADIGLRPSRRHSLHRSDNDGNYEPGNVSWVLPAVQNRNQRSTQRYEFHGALLAIGEIAERTAVPHTRIYQRIRRGWSAMEAATMPVGDESDRHDLYKRWWQIVARCTDTTHPAYGNYGGRGITVCERWRISFAAFAEDVGYPPFPGATVERVDNAGSYEPANFRWASRVEQTRNRRNTKILELSGQRRPMAEWADLAGMDYEVVKKRIWMGWALDEALGTPRGFGRCGKDERRSWLGKLLAELVAAPDQWRSAGEDARVKIIDHLVAIHRVFGLQMPSAAADPIARVARARVILEGDTFTSISAVGQDVCLQAHPHRLEARHAGNLSIAEALKDEATLRRALHYQLKRNDPATPNGLMRALAALVRAPRNFPPALMRWIVDSFAPPGGVVLDPCSGYGGRLLGALASSRGVTYIGFDVEPRNVAGNVALAAQLNAASRVHQECRAVEVGRWPRADLVVTSPPYYDLEDYGPAARATLAQYGSYAEWRDGFLRTLITKALTAAPTVVLNLANSRGHDLPGDAAALLPPVGVRLRILRWPLRAFGKRPGREEKLLVITKVGA